MLEYMKKEKKPANEFGLYSETAFGSMRSNWHGKLSPCIRDIEQEKMPGAMAAAAFRNAPENSTSAMPTFFTESRTVKKPKKVIFAKTEDL